MHVVLRWRRNPESCDRRLSRFIRVLLAALRVPRYRAQLDAIGLGGPGAVDRLTSIEQTLERLPSVPLAEFLSSPEEFRNPYAPKPARSRLECPLPPQPRTAVFMPHFEETRSIRVFSESKLQALARWTPEAIAGPVSFLVGLAQRVNSGDIFLPPLPRCLIAFTSLDDGALDSGARDLLWQVFQVPVFEQWLGLDGRLVATECDAHEGLHLIPENVVLEQNGGLGTLLTSLTDVHRPALRLATPFTATIEHAKCGCGRTTPRLVGLRCLPQPRRGLAASS